MQNTGPVQLTAVVKDSYYNMKEKIEPHMELIHIAENAMRKMELLRLFPRYVRNRRRQTVYMGLPCPNLCTGGHNYHGKYEYVCVESMEQTVNILTEIVKSFAVGKCRLIDKKSDLYNKISLWQFKFICIYKH